MKVFNRIVDLQNELFDVRREGKKMVGFVPTMGALHEGHASLIKKSVEDNDITVVSVFLNPTQFNDKGDLERYPRTLDADCALVESCGADIVFAPTVEEMYPTPDQRHFEFPPVTTVMEGARRPGHFNGVCQVVSRLFYIVKPDRAYFGEKDWQQIAVIKQLVKYINSDVEIVECPTVRETNGLAKSSRNTLLTDDERAIAPKIYATLVASVEYAKSHTVQETHDKVVADINAVEGLEVEYFSIVDGNMLTDVESWDAPYIAGCITVYCGKTPIRLIDHITYKNKN
ncbi:MULTISPECIES: pantoate--beta-alanine ligase [Segatella]|jgi:pantoate--beta-alanine ligase|uniref:Pantothenate synthetase n=2 Tax=Segatella TaxID=2974251 RepID=D8DWA8_9BACT|nr:MULTISPECIES: pantoate--beta-alanine ligase [Segatella]MBQ3857823.1 pantoate--beta-alanine ligase [Prevotella sp.]EFI72168.1 pantoate--beta-alanine ligase [Segatella baroniae B14]MDR4930849.1 pantoate--beta-alanine ligase [Segatella bryantii]OYP53397.1 pantoate--beta-alanine ligase [Segatella bryantii]UKK78584.1 pantoate--beta-alanine ligase [Segatella baroniae B14]